MEGPHVRGLLKRGLRSAVSQGWSRAGDAPHPHTVLPRVISRAQGLKLVVETLMSSLKPIGNIVVICCAFFIIFGILGVQVHRGPGIRETLRTERGGLSVLRLKLLPLTSREDLAGTLPPWA